MLSPSDLAGMQGQQEAALPNQMLIRRKTSVPDGLGGLTDTVTSLGPYPCRLAPVRGKETTEGLREVATAGEILSYPHDLVLRELDEVVIDGVTYSVTSIEEDRAWKTAGRAMLRRVS